MFRFEDGHVSYKSRFVRNERYVAQEEAGKLLFPMYRNPYLDDPSVKGKSRGTHNTHIHNFNGKLLALKEDSPPAAMDLNTLETLDPVFRFDGQLESAAFTAHPKVDSVTGNMVAFGYEAKGFNTKDINVFEYSQDGKKVWEAWVQVPYVGMIHDFAVTQNYIVFYNIPLAFDEAQIQRGGIHWSWYPGQPTYFGFMRRGGDGKDIRWVKGPERSSTHVMGCFDDGKKLFVDVEMSASNPFPFMPMRDGSRWDPVKGASRITRLSVDLTKKVPKDYGIEVLFPNHLGALPRQDDRYNTAHYRYGFLPCPDPDPKDPAQAPLILLGTLRRADAHLAALSRARRRTAAGSLLRTAQQGRTRRQRLSHGRRDLPCRERARGSRDPRCGAHRPGAGCHGEAAYQDRWADSWVVGAGGVDSEEGLKPLPRLRGHSRGVRSRHPGFFLGHTLRSPSRMSSRSSGCGR